MLEQNLKSKINQLWDKFWSGGIANPLTAIEQMSYLIFIKRIEDEDNKRTKRALAKKEDYKSIFDGKIKIGSVEYNKKDCRWSEWKHLPAEEMITHVREVVFPFLKNLHNGEGSFFAEHMKDAIFLIPKASLLQEAVAIVDELNITKQNVDTQGDIYEYLLNELKTSGKNGQFRTPRHIIRMMCELVDPNINDKICDPACGTAGFLVNAYEYIIKKYTSEQFLKEEKDGDTHGLIGDKITNPQAWEKLRKDTFFGYDFDTTMVKIALMNMLLHGITNPQITYLDALSKRHDIKPKYTVVLANPPFTGSIDESDINDGFRVKTTKTELLFLELFYQLLEIGGRAAIVVPNGVLFGSSNAHKEIRKLLLEKSQLEAVISLPSGVFKPYSGVGTAILVFTKGGSTEKVWFYDMKSDGYTLDDKRDFIDGQGDIPDIIKKFKTKIVSENSLVVSFDEIKSNEYSLSISRYKEVKHEEVVYDNPDEIVDRVIKKEEEISQELRSLKDDFEERTSRRNEKRTERWVIDE